ncbi:MAG: DNA replication protein DnaD [Vulcanisaeta sp.]|jgi:sec-independent protein translocase protein TatA|uniref:DNA replication protein DnaD n=1 Tax=Vulcanisaeta sp. TaxID=2020871 RepID=UPI003D144D11
MHIYLVLDEQTSILIFLFFLILIAWKPESLPKIARELGKWYNWARRSMDDFLREVNEPINETKTSINNTTLDIKRAINDAIDPDLLRIAKALNINTQGRSRQEVIDEIMKKLSSNNK